MKQPQPRTVALGKLKDLTIGLDPITQPFLYHLPYLIEQNLIKPTQIDSFVVFAQHAREASPPPVLADALNILNQVVNPDDGSLRPISSATFFDNRNFTWKELGTFTDPKSLIFHVVNRTAMQLELGRE